jgi:L-ascorbate metabolism protein UlaG (beta-lactamase superfamily)
MAQVEYRSNPQLSFIREDYPGNAFQDGQFLPYTPYEHPGFWDIMKWQFSSNPQKQEKKQDDFAPEVVEGTDFLDEKEDFILWLGHASFLIRLSGLTLLLDPCLRSLPLLSRKVGLPCEIEEIKGVDYLLMSHGHRDHFDIPSLKTLIPNNFGVEMLVPLGMAPLIESIGMERYQEAGWYQEYQTDEKLNITFLPAHHWNRRGLNDHNSMLWGSFLIESFDHRIYFAADTGYASHFQEIREVIGEDIDICLMPIGAYKPASIMKNSHTTPEEAVQAFHELGGSRFIPMHYGTYDLADEPMGEPIRKVRAMAAEEKLQGELVELKVGEIYLL